jgi:hypothetical protein
MVIFTGTKNFAGSVKMNDEIKRRLLAYLDKFEGSVDKAVDFTAEQMPLYLTELCQYTIVHSIMVTAIFAAFAFAIWLFMIVLVLKDKDDDRVEKLVVGHFFFAILMFIPATIVVDIASDGVKAYFAPRVFVVDKITELVK